MGTATGIGPSQKKLSIIDFKKKNTMNLPKISSRHKLIKFERMQLLLTIHIATPNSPLSIEKKTRKTKCDKLISPQCPCWGYKCHCRCPT